MPGTPQLGQCLVPHSWVSVWCLTAGLVSGALQVVLCLGPYSWVSVWCVMVGAVPGVSKVRVLGQCMELVMVCYSTYNRSQCSVVCKRDITTIRQHPQPKCKQQPWLVSISTDIGDLLKNFTCALDLSFPCPSCKPWVPLLP